MTFEEFSRIIRKGLQEQLEDGISISLDQVKGNNGTVRTVLTLSRGKGGLSPGFDMRSLYEQYQEMGEDWESMNQVLRLLREAGSGIGRERAKREEIGLRAMEGIHCVPLGQYGEKPGALKGAPWYPVPGFEPDVLGLSEDRNGGDCGVPD